LLAVDVLLAGRRKAENKIYFGDQGCVCVCVVRCLLLGKPSPSLRSIDSPIRPSLAAPFRLFPNLLRNLLLFPFRPHVFGTNASILEYRTFFEVYFGRPLERIEDSIPALSVPSQPRLSAGVAEWLTRMGRIMNGTRSPLNEIDTSMTEK
jgi:hypothetical protein